MPVFVQKNVKRTGARWPAELGHPQSGGGAQRPFVPRSGGRTKLSDLLLHRLLPEAPLPHVWASTRVCSFAQRTV